jgi:hypothetical protein
LHLALRGARISHAKNRHGAFTTFVVNVAKQYGVPICGGGFGSVKGIFSKNINQSNVRPEDQAALNGIIPDALIDSRSIPQLTDFHFTKINGVFSLVEVKSSYRSCKTVDARATRINSDIKKAAIALDAKHAGSTVLVRPQGQSYYSKIVRGLQKEGALRQGAHNSVARNRPEIFPG